MRKNSHALDIFLFDWIKSSEKLDDWDLQNVATEVEKPNVDWLWVIACDCEMNCSSRVLVNEAQNTQICYSSRID